MLMQEHAPLRCARLRCAESSAKTVILVDAIFIPALVMQVHSFDRMERSAVQGYGYLNMASHVPGCRRHTVEMWRPVPTTRQQISEFFIGGAPELESNTFVTYPEGCDPAAPGGVLNKIGAITERSGTVEVRRRGHVFVVLTLLSALCRAWAGHFAAYLWLFHTCAVIVLTCMSTSLIGL